jgi:serine O-acetyltransferase
VKFGAISPVLTPFSETKADAGLTTVRGALGVTIATTAATPAIAIREPNNNFIMLGKNFQSRFGLHRNPAKGFYQLLLLPFPRRRSNQYARGGPGVNHPNSKLASAHFSCHTAPLFMNPVEDIWTQIRAEALATARREAALAPLIEEVFLRRDSLEDALSVRLARKLAYHATPESQLQDIFREALQSDPKIIRQVRADIVAIKERDPACRSFLTPMLYFKGFHAITCHRIAHYLWMKGREDLALYMQSLVAEVLAVDIHPAARIGSGILLDHATGFVAGETSAIDDNVSILHGVTLGGTGKEQGDRHPKIRSGVLIGAGAKILGNIIIGEGAKIGANSVVLHAVPPHATVAGVPARIVGRAEQAEPSRGMSHNLDNLEAYIDRGDGI